MIETDPKDFISLNHGKYSLQFKVVSYTIKTYGPVNCVLIVNTSFVKWMPSEVKKRVFWGLLTNAPSFQATTIIQHYRDRW